MKLIAKCSAFVSLSYQVHVKVCNPISLITVYFYDNVQIVRMSESQFYFIFEYLKTE